MVDIEKESKESTVRGLAETIMTNLSPVLEGATEVFFTMDVERTDVAEQGDRPDDRFEFRFKAERSEADYITVKMYDRYTFLHAKDPIIRDTFRSKFYEAESLCVKIADRINMVIEDLVQGKSVSTLALLLDRAWTPR